MRTATPKHKSNYKTIEQKNTYEMIDTSPIIVKKILKLALTPNGRSLNITRNGNPINQ